MDGEIDDRCIDSQTDKSHQVNHLGQAQVVVRGKFWNGPYKRETMTICHNF